MYGAVILLAFLEWAEMNCVEIFPASFRIKDRFGGAQGSQVVF